MVCSLALCVLYVRALYDLSLLVSFNLCPEHSVIYYHTGCVIIDSQ